VTPLIPSPRDETPSPESSRRARPSSSSTRYACGLTEHPREDLGRVTGFSAPPSSRARRSLPLRRRSASSARR
jgi:hypothetical protein